MEFAKRNLALSTCLLLLGLVIREVFSFWTGHPYDFELWVRLGYAMVNGGDPYGSLAPVPGLSFANIYSLRDTATIAYLPFWPIVTGVLFMVYSVVGFGDRFVYYFLLKQPIILGDIALAYLLYSYVRFKKPSAALWVLRFWVLSPFTIILSGVWGMFDSIAMSFIMISVMTTRHVRRGFWAGLGTFAKSVPVIYAVPLSVNRSQNWQSFLMATMLPITLSAATFAAMGWSLPAITSALTYTVTRWGESMSAWDLLFYFNYLGILPTPTLLVSSFVGSVWIPAVIIMTAIAYRKFKFGTDYGLVQSLLVVTLTFLIFKARVTEQYAIYLLALSILDVVLWNARRRPILLATTVIATIYLLTNNYFLLRFLAPVYPNVVQIESSLSQMIGPVRLAVNFALGSAFTVLNVWYLMKILGNKKQVTSESDLRSPTRGIGRFSGKMRSSVS